MSRISPTAEGFRTAFRRPLLTLGEIAWRWIVGATATALFFFGLFEFLDTLPVTSGELFFLRTRNPYLVAQAIAHIFRGSSKRAVVAGVLAALLIGLLWSVAGAVGRIATVRGLLEYFRRDVAGNVSAGGAGKGVIAGTDRDFGKDGGFQERGERDVASNVSTTRSSPFAALIRLNFLRAAVALAAVFGIFGAAILAGFASPDGDPQPGVAFLLFLPLAALVGLAWSSLNWLLSLASIFAIRDGDDAAGAISAAVTFCREHTGGVFAVSAWTSLARLVVFVGATTVGSMPLAFLGTVPWRLVVLAMILVSLGYFVVADWLYMARLAGYVCIAETPEALLAPLSPAPQPYVPPSVLPPAQPVQTAPIETTIDRDEPILSDVPNLPILFVET
jgi:hypothetical protein